MPIKAYRKKPIVCQALQFNGINLKEVLEFIGSEPPERLADMATCMYIPTPEGKARCNKDDWIIEGHTSELGIHYWVVKPDFFAENYSEVLKPETAEQEATEHALKKMIYNLTNTKNQAYNERNKCVAALAHLLSCNGFSEYKVYVTLHPESDKDWESTWRTILVIQRRDYQMTWHFHDSESHLLDGLPVQDTYEWDGHTTEEKYQRLAELFITSKRICYL